MKQSVMLYMLLALLAGCAAPAGDGQSAALRQWQARPIAHYTLHTREVVGGRPCAQIVEVRDEQLVRVINDTCQHPNLWTVSWLFSYASRARSPVDRCALLDPAAGCICRDAADVQVEYDPARGYPRAIVVRQTWRPNWQGLGYWLYAAQHIALPACTPPFSDPGRRVVVRELKPLP